MGRAINERGTMLLGKGTVKPATGQCGVFILRETAKK